MTQLTWRETPRRRAGSLSCPAQPVMIKTGFVQRYAVLRGDKAPDDALARELGAMELLLSQRARR
jgi:hypothetical protein